MTISHYSHTPSPWRIGPDKSHDTDIFADEDRICNIGHGFVNHDTYLLHTKMISLAPEIYDKFMILLYGFEAKLSPNLNVVQQSSDIISEIDNMKGNYLPAPWLLLHNVTSYSSDIYSKGKGKICDVFKRYREPSAYLANCRLITVLPEIYEGMKEMINIVVNNKGIDDDIMDRANFALNKYVKGGEEEIIYTN